jgi:hypothetical protein
MGRSDQRCSICSAPETIRAMVNAELAKEPGKRLTLRQLEKISHFSKSALSKHSRRCLFRKALLDHRANFFSRGDRIHVHWPNDPPLTDEEVVRRANGNRLWIIDVCFVRGAIQNPAALENANKVYRKTAGMPAAETPKPADSAAFAQPEAEASSAQACAESFLLSTVKSPGTPSPEPPQECQHDMRRVSGDILRCIACGFQQTAFQPVGFSFAEVAEMKNRRRRF